MTQVAIARIELHRAGGPIPRQGNARTTWERRDSIIVALHDGEGRVGLGEAAPLPGFGEDALDLAALQAREPSSPAVAYALELAELDLRGQQDGLPLHRLLSGERSRSGVEVSALLGDPRGDDAIDRARSLLARGARTLKLKLANGSVDDDVAAVVALRAALGPAIALIGDANGAWTLDQARNALERLAPLDLDYVEQPVGPADLMRLGPSAIPVWADESLADPRMREEVLDSPDIAGVVCKPTVLGGVGASRDLARRAGVLGKRTVITHALEGPVAFAGCAALALSLRDVATRAGLWPHGALAAFPEAALPGYANGMLVATDRPGLGFTDDERRRILALPKIGETR